MLVGQGSHFEIWDMTTWQERLDRALQQVGANPPPGTDNFSL
jgi:MraZ protein